MYKENFKTQMTSFMSHIADLSNFPIVRQLVRLIVLKNTTTALLVSSNHLHSPTKNFKEHQKQQEKSSIPLFKFSSQAFPYVPLISSYWSFLLYLVKLGSHNYSLLVI